MNESRASLYPLLTGLAGGALAWSGVEILLLSSSLFPDFRSLSLALGAVAGILLGAVAPMAEGLRQSQPRKVAVSVLVGALTGAIAGALGMAAGQLLLSMAADSLAISGAGLASRGAAMARIPGWAILGAAVGASSGIRSRSGRRIIAGAVGGLIGGLFGGMAAEALSAVTLRFFGRGAGMILWGVAVAFLADRMEARRSRGRLTVLAGPLKGRSFPVNQKKFLIGRTPGADLTVPGNIPGDRGGKTVLADKESHAATLKMSGGTVILEADSKNGIEVNGRKADKTELRYDDIVKVDGVTMIYEARR